MLDQCCMIRRFVIRIGFVINFGIQFIKRGIIRKHGCAIHTQFRCKVGKIGRTRRFGEYGSGSIFGVHSILIIIVIEI